MRITVALKVVAFDNNTRSNVVTFDPSYAPIHDNDVCQYSDL